MDFLVVHFPAFRKSRRALLCAASMMYAADELAPVASVAASIASFCASVQRTFLGVVLGRFVGIVALLGLQGTLFVALCVAFSVALDSREYATQERYNLYCIP